MKTTFAIALVLLAAFAISAQEQQIDKTVFDAALDGTTATSKWTGKTYRLTVTTSAKVDGPGINHEAKMVFEYGPDRAVRSSSSSSTSNTNSSPAGTVTRKSDTLSVGDKVYRRDNGGPWTVNARVPATSPSTAAPNEDPTETLKSDIRYYSLGSQAFKGETALVYKKVENVSKVYKANGSVTDSVITNTYWIVGGVQRKHELRSANKGTTYTSNNLVLSEWDLDPTITFEPPITAK